MQASLRTPALTGTKIIQTAVVVGSLLLLVWTGSAAENRVWAGPLGNEPVGTNTPPVEQYYPVADGHWVSLALDWGARVKLEDGSVWEIASKDQSKTRNWMVAQKISVSQNPSGRYPFRLTNTDQKAVADARLIFRPR